MIISNNKLDFFKKFTEYYDLNIYGVSNNEYILCDGIMCSKCKFSYCDKRGEHIFTKEELDEIRLLYPEYFI